MTDESAQSAATPTPGKAALFLLVLVPVLAGYIALALALGLQSYYAGFLFLLYWTGFRAAQTSEFTPALVGMLAAVALCWLLRFMPERWGGWGYVVPMALILLSIFYLLCSWLPILVNYAFMLMLTVGSAQPIMANNDFSGMAWSIVVSAIYFGAIKLLADAFHRRAAARA